MVDNSRVARVLNTGHWLMLRTLNLNQNMMGSLRKVFFRRLTSFDFFSKGFILSFVKKRLKSVNVGQQVKSSLL